MRSAELRERFAPAERRSVITYIMPLTISN